jgi:hypothetical protein
MILTRNRIILYASLGGVGFMLFGNNLPFFEYTCSMDRLVFMAKINCAYLMSYGLFYLIIPNTISK